MANKIIITTAPGRRSTEWAPREVTWENIAAKLSTPVVTKETVEEYAAMSKESRDRCKDVGGFVGGALGDGGRPCKGPRKAERVLYRQLVTLDMDYAKKNAPDVVEDTLYGTAYILYSTHSHTSGKPRYRLVIPLSRPVTPMEYGAISRRVAADIDIEQFDDTTYQPERLMYWGSRSKDGEYVYVCREGDLLDADSVLATYTDPENTFEWPVSSRLTKALTPAGKHQEDPRMKRSIVGAFCRTYTIHEAIAAFLSDVYEPTALPDRYTYKGGSTAAGAIVYDGMFIYSNHATDPISCQLCNAFDMVRLHLYGGLDGDKDEYTPAGSKPSYLAMKRMAESDERVIDTLKSEQLEDIETDFGSLVTETGAPEGKKEKPDTGWLKKCMDDKGRFVSNAYTFQLICENDPRLAGLTRYDVFTDRHVLQRDTPWARRGEDHAYWTDIDDNGLVCYMAEHYKGLTGKQAIIDAHDLVMSRAAYHPVRDYLNGIPGWDGVGRLDTLVIDFLGAADDRLTRAMTRKHFTAAVARIFEPGIKYDQILTFSGKEGAGKSTLIRRMGKGVWTNDSFSPGDIGDKQAMEQVRGCWLIEMAEMVAYKKSTSEAFKAFISKQRDEYRPAYGRKKITVERQCVFFNTTNEENFLKGDTGNRRFWLIHIEPERAKYDIFKFLSDSYVDMVWAEAVYRYREGEALYLEDYELARMATERQDQFNEIESDDRMGLIEEFIKKEVPDNWEQLTPQQRSDYFKYGTGPGVDFQGTHRRKYICAIEIANECFHKDMTRYEKREINQMLHRIKGLTEMSSMRTSDGAYGGQRRYRLEPELWEDEDVE